LEGSSRQMRAFAQRRVNGEWSTADHRADRPRPYGDDEVWHTTAVTTTERKCPLWP